MHHTTALLSPVTNISSRAIDLNERYQLFAIAVTFVYTLINYTTRMYIQLITNIFIEKLD